mgnify:CR=1 FL=1
MAGLFEIETDIATTARQTNDAASWRRFTRLFLGLFGGAITLLTLAVIVANPFRAVPYRTGGLPLMTSEQRLLYPSIARDPAFDSAVFGTSSIRLLRPSLLDAELGGRFAQLAIDNATAWEELQVAALFARSRPAGQTVRRVILGIDVRWCTVETASPPLDRHAFPATLYDQSRLNDLQYLLSFASIEAVGRLAKLLNDESPRFDAAGYGNFLPPDSEYDLARVREKLWGNAGRDTRQPPQTPVALSESERAALPFASHAALRDFLALWPDQTEVLLLFVPYHIARQPVEGSRGAAHWAECRRRIVDIARSRPRTGVADMMIASPVTREDSNYWDPLHYRIGVADRLPGLIAGAWLQGKDLPEIRVLHYPGM